MASISGVVVSVYPGDKAEGVPLLAGVNILFNTELDENTIEQGGVILEGPDTDKFLVPTYPEIINKGDEAALLNSPGYAGLVPGKFSFKRISPTTTAEVAVADTTGAGNLYRTKAIFTPLFPLQKATTYRLYIVGDPDSADTDKFGIATRSIFDVVADPANTGTGMLVASGTYLGSFSDTFTVNITAEGVLGVAKFEWWRNSSPLDVQGPATLTYSSIPLSDNVSVRFNDGLYKVGDKFTFVVKPGSVYEGTLVSTFTTGNGSISEIPTTASTSVVGDVLPVGHGADPFTVKSTSPKDFATNLPPTGVKQIVVEFSSAIDPTTVTAETVRVTAEPVSDHPSANITSPNGEIAKTLTVSGTKLFIVL